jgi:3-oxoacyl-[acyl-carrier protein] reductase
MTARRIPITGASRGIGYSLAERLAGLGHQPAGLARTAPAGFPGEFHEVDLASRTATGAALEKVLSGGPGPRPAIATRTRARRVSAAGCLRPAWRNPS